MKLFIETYGCDTNRVTTEIMAAALIKSDHAFVPKSDAELVIINSCDLEPVIQRKILKRLAELRDSNTKTLVIGCMGEAEKNLVLQKNPNASVAGVASATNIAEIVGKISAGNQVTRFSDKPRPLIGFERVRINGAVATIQIAEGCLEGCTFCIDRTIIGSLRSYDSDKILRELNEAISAGCIEIHLSAQDTASYGIDSGVRLPALLRKIGVISGKYRVKLGPMNPATVLPILGDLVSSFGRPNMYQYIDLPLESGSETILDAMRRKYTVSDYKRIVSAFRERYAAMTLSTDVIVGFPGETEDDYKATVAVLEEVKPDILNVYAYGEMPLTKSGPTNVPSWKIKDRFTELNKLAAKFKQDSLGKWGDWSGEVYISEKTADGYIARNYAYAPVFVRKAEIGQIGMKEIGGATESYLVAR